VDIFVSAHVPAFIDVAAEQSLAPTSLDNSNRTPLLHSLHFYTPTFTFVQYTAAFDFFDVRRALL
jgi:hypothetical protein